MPSSSPFLKGSSGLEQEPKERHGEYSWSFGLSVLAWPLFLNLSIIHNGIFIWARNFLLPRRKKETKFALLLPIQVCFTGSCILIPPAWRNHFAVCRSQQCGESTQRSLSSVHTAKNSLAAPAERIWLCLYCHLTLDSLQTFFYFGQHAPAVPFQLHCASNPVLSSRTRKG